MPSARRRLRGAIFAVLLLAGASGCDASRSTRTPANTSTPQASVQSTTNTQTPVAAATPQAPGSCQIAPPQVHIPAGEWTATGTVLATEAIDGCAGERLVRPWDFRRLCKAGICKTYLFTVSYYGVGVAHIVPDGRDRYLGVFQPTTVPCPHRPGEDSGTNRSYSTITLWWSSDMQVIHGLSRERQVGPCGGGGPPETYSYVARRTDPAGTPLAEGP
jgi:hypothetical protein